nr:hypothetical protein [Gammaproteobacteria bacterium]NIR93553.1 hypothetical protein [Gammaproteobacteria bacterium]NIW47018.1 hypothetical protein [Gammaproteobacteria bacterium]
MSYSLFRITSSGPAARAGWPLMLMVLVMLGGCAQGSNIADLQEYVSDLKSKKGRIEELP